jgi:RNA polymerase primary sigma factor
MAKTNAADTNEKPDNGDAPLIDLNEASLKKLIARAKKRGIITVDELNDVTGEMSTDQIEDVMSALSDMGVNVVENEESDEDEPAAEADQDSGLDDNADGDGGTFVVEKKKETVDRTDDPVRMYLREMGAVELLSREGEIAIAKRIEAGRDTMIWGLCESPITFNAIIEWSNALNNGHMQLREILDLEAMLSKGPTPEQVEGAEEGGDDISESTAGPSFKEEEEVEEAAPEEDEDEDSMVERRAPRPAEEEEEDNTLSLAQMEETLKPQALEKFAKITDLFKKFSRLQNSRMDSMSAGETFGKATRRSIRTCASSSPPRSRASSSTAPRSNIWSTSSTATAAA